MTPLLLFGASRGTGLEVARLARSQGYAVYAMTRSHSAELEKIGVQQLSGDVFDKKRLAEIFIDFPTIPTVVCSLGGGHSDGEGTINLIEAAHLCMVHRFILISSLGAGESRAHASERLLAAIGTVLEEKTRAEDCLRAGKLAFTIIRPGQLIDGPYTAKAVLSEDPGIHGSISRTDLASLVMHCVERPQTAGRIYSAVATFR